METDPSAMVEAVLGSLRSCYGTPERGPSQDPMDELIQTILSQHTSDTNTDRAFASLKSQYPRWDDVVDAPTEDVVEAIRMGGLANVKAPRIQQVLRDIRERTGGFDLRFLDNLPLEEARGWLTTLQGVGPKTASCVLLFSLRRPAMPVDTHVHRVASRLGLIPAKTSAERAHEMLERLFASEEMYDAHMLLIQHGRQTCTARWPRCAACVLRDRCPSAGDARHPSDEVGRT